MPPTLLLITASAPGIRRARRARFLSFQQITMPYLAARVPPGWRVFHVDEEAERIDWSLRPDVVAITFHTPSAGHAYDLAARFRGLGACVVMGGPHVTLLPEEAARHADVIFIGEAEGVWEEFLDAFPTGSYRRVYQRDTPPSLVDAPFAAKHLFHRRDWSNGVLFATRGCPNHCDFCVIAAMYPHGFRHRPVAEVAAEYASFRGKRIIFWDDNIAGDRKYARQLFRAIAPHRKWWSSQASLHIGKDDELLEDAARSGCKQLFLGLESISQASMNGVRKGFNRVEEYARVIARIHAHGIAVQAGIVFGFDQDTPAVFKETLDFLEDTGIQNATFNILTPYPGTPLFRRLESEGRILTRDWAKFNAREDVVFQPRQMSPAELLAGFRYANQRFYSIPSIARRLGRSPVGLWWTLPLNLAYAASWAAWSCTQSALPRRGADNQNHPKLRSADVAQALVPAASALLPTHGGPCTAPALTRTVAPPRRHSNTLENLAIAGSRSLWGRRFHLPTRAKPGLRLYPDLCPAPGPSNTPVDASAGRSTRATSGAADTSVRTTSGQ